MIKELAEVFKKHFTFFGKKHREINKLYSSNGKRKNKI